MKDGEHQVGSGNSRAQLQPAGLCSYDRYSQVRQMRRYTVKVWQCRAQEWHMAGDCRRAAGPYRAAVEQVQGERHYTQPDINACSADHQKGMQPSLFSALHVLVPWILVWHRSPERVVSPSPRNFAVNRRRPRLDLHKSEMICTLRITTACALI